MSEFAKAILSRNMILFRPIAFLFFLFICLNPGKLCAQLETDQPGRFYMDKKNMYQGQTKIYRGTAGMHSSLEMNSTAVTNSFLKGLLFQGFASEQLKDDVSAKLQSHNRIGMDFNAGITGTFHARSLTLIVGLGYREHFDSRFSKDLFEILFRGNKRYEEKYADLSSSQLNYLNYQSFYMGLSRQLPDVHWILGGGISILSGGQYQQLNIQRASLYTASGGEYVDLNTAFDGAYTTRRAGFLSSGGSGLAIHLSLSHWTRKSRFNVEMRDLGFIHWKNTNGFSTDSSYRYEGLEVKNILSYNDYTFDGINADSLKSQFNISEHPGSLSKWIPFSFSANYTYLYSSKVNFVVGAKYLALANYVPRIYVKTLFYLKERFMLAPALSYGGYGKFNLEITAVQSFKDKWVASGGITCLGYFLFPRNTQGCGMQLSLVRVF